MEQDFELYSFEMTDKITLFYVPLVRFFPVPAIATHVKTDNEMFPV